MLPGSEQEVPSLLELPWSSEETQHSPADIVTETAASYGHNTRQRLVLTLAAGSLPETVGSIRIPSNVEDGLMYQGQAMMWAPGPDEGLQFHPNVCQNLSPQCHRLTLSGSRAISDGTSLALNLLSL